MSATAGWLGAGRRRRSWERRGWETRHGSSYMLHIMEALAEGQSRHSGGASDDWGQRGGTGGGQAPTDIEGQMRKPGRRMRKRLRAVGGRPVDAKATARRRRPAGGCESDRAPSAARPEKEWVREGRRSKCKLCEATSGSGREQGVRAQGEHTAATALKGLSPAQVGRAGTRAESGWLRACGRN